jgi:hypothetical protein
MRDRANALIRFQSGKAAGQGFVTSFGGLPFLPATIPANILSLFYIWIRMSAAIAHMGGHDIETEQTKALVFLTILGGDVPDLTQIGEGDAFTQMIIKRILVAFGRKTAGNVARKAIPIVAGFANAAYDANWTDSIGNVARDIFIPPEWIREEQARTGLGVSIFFPDSRSWVEAIRERIEEEEIAEGEKEQTALTLRREYYDKQVLPKVVAARSEMKRSTYISISNETPWVLCLSEATAAHGEWTVAAPADILPGERDVPCGVHLNSTFAREVQATLEFLAETDLGQVKIWLQVIQPPKTTTVQSILPVVLPGEF